MAEPFDAIRYIGYLKVRWRWIAVSAGVAATLAVAVSLMMARQYTATARIVVEPPAGADLRSAMAVSPIYFESLRTFEHFATSDSLFQNAVDQLGIRALAGDGALETLKRRILKVGMVRNTRILEVSATLPDARKAQAMAQFVAEATVAMNRAVASEGDRDLLRDSEKHAADARARLEQLEAEWAKLLAREPVREIESDLASSSQLLSRMREQALSVELDMTEERQRAKQAAAEERALIEKQQASSRVRLDELRKQIATLEQQSAEREKLLADRMARREDADAERKAAQAALVAADTHVRDVRGGAGYRGERLRVIDPGVVPERPSSPNLPLNLIAAVLLALVFSVLYLTIAMNLEAGNAAERRTFVRAMARARDE